MHRPLLDPLGITFPQYLVILELLNRAPVSVGALGARIGMTQGRSRRTYPARRWC
ncbi:MarR family winged helix-turn-helix transcriptional regulator [Rhizorhabdus argentea]|uniref:MarR family winged helix-turn-helix transcriptional regulator n=1 Tax=Rhizorhabdus argentea TaxID=1387174 RepID=UPI0030EDAD6F